MFWTKEKKIQVELINPRLVVEPQPFPARQGAVEHASTPASGPASLSLDDSLKLAAVVAALFRERGAFSSTDTAPGHFYESFLRNLRVKEQTHMEYLDEVYGSLRAPIKLKEQEFSGGDIYTNPTRQVLYDSPNRHLSELHEAFADPDVKYLIWAVSRDGALLLGQEVWIDTDGVMKPCGHPSITKFRPARIAGELWKSGDGWQINSKSGRYSFDYDDSGRLLDNALKKFQAFFPKDSFAIKPPDSLAALVAAIPDVPE